MDFNVNEVPRAAVMAYQLTSTFIVIGIVLVVLIDVYFAFIDKVEGNTISNVMSNWVSSKYFVITWISGVVCGHLFLARLTPAFGNPWSMIILGVITLVLFGIGFWRQPHLGPWWQFGLLMGGILMGHLCWPIKKMIIIG